MEVIFSQFRLGYIRLNAPLHKRKQVDSHICEHCPVEETITHFLLTCPKYRQQRYTLAHKPRELNIKELNLESLLSNTYTTREVEKYIEATGRLK